MKTAETNAQWAEAHGLGGFAFRYAVCVLSPRHGTFRDVMLTNNRERATHMRYGLVAEGYPMPIVEDRMAIESWV